MEMTRRDTASEHKGARQMETGASLVLKLAMTMASVGDAASSVLKLVAVGQAVVVVVVAVLELALEKRSAR